MFALLLCPLAFALDGRSSVYFPSAEPLLGKYGRMELNAILESNSEPTIGIQSTLGLPKGILDVSYQYPNSGMLGYRYPVHVKTLWSVAPFVCAQFNEDVFTAAGMANLFHVSTYKVDVAVALVHYSEMAVVPPQSLKQMEAGFAFVPAPRQEIRIGYAHHKNHEMNLRYQRAGDWISSDIILIGGRKSWKIQAGLGVRR